MGESVPNFVKKRGIKIALGRRQLTAPYPKSNAIMLFKMKIILFILKWLYRSSFEPDACPFYALV